MHYRDSKFFEELDRRAYIAANAASVNLIEKIEEFAVRAGDDGLFIPAS